jgi:plastocyanin
MHHNMRRTALRVITAVTALVAGLVLLAPPATGAERPGRAAPEEVPLAVPTQGAGADTTISVDDNFFEPKRVTVEVGDKVTWKWDGFVAHNVVVKKGPQKFKSKIQSEGKFSRTIKDPGRYRIVCTLHPGMTMRLRAVEPPPATTAPPAT